MSRVRPFGLLASGREPVPRMKGGADVYRPAGFRADSSVVAA